METISRRCLAIAANCLRLRFALACQRFASLLIVLAFSATANAVVMHPNHVSLAEIEFNPKTESLEVSLCVWPEDVSHVINQLNGDPVELNDQTLRRLLPDYLEGKFVVRPLIKTDEVTLVKPQSLPIRWVGAEIGVKKAWLYFEIKSADSEQGWEIDNKIFCELNEDQVNHISFRVRSSRRSYPIQRFECDPASKAYRTQRKPARIQ